ncbi:urease accessory protein UreF [Hyalangium rubrum]|uniref:Urease accessory protein UreF n=1 Tax=Hyalangium rubrum TaxID=3103134 RepID=A0ABU5GX79_9BACT|nr:urease accessory UreF family protein [Hyalangium sp. s54d21]MDY7225798.1 urease accessory UreF family protein [Hyalangium sp. s54d21]
MSHRWRILQLADSAFPTGGFSHSAGLEAAAQQGEVSEPAALRTFLEGSLWQAGHGGLPFLRAAYAPEAEASTLDRWCDAFLSSHVANRASRTQGRALVATASRIFPEAELRRLHEAARARTLLAHYAPMFGLTLRVLAVPLEQAQELFLHLALRGVASAAVRLGLLGPHEAQRLHHELASVQDAVLARCGPLSLNELSQPSPLIDLLGATHDRLYTRLFQS